MAAGLTVVVDYGTCNIDSMVRALEECGATRVMRSGDARDIAKADRIVLPGVGSFATAMRNLTQKGLVDALREASGSRTVPFLGACLGMHLMADGGTEGGGGARVPGLGLVAGSVERLVPANEDERIPHIGWNEVIARPNSVLLAGVPASADFYFVHSFHFRITDPAVEAGRTPFCGGFTSGIEDPSRAIFGAQFHPEKSQKNGFRLLRNFLAI